MKTITGKPSPHRVLWAAAGLMLLAGGLFVPSGTSADTGDTGEAAGPTGKIVFQTVSGGEIYIVNADGTDQRPLFPQGTLDGLTLEYHNVDERVLSWQ